jgi:NAD(P)H-dependent flavin oxidoreductase YrpB (nitropropane dioxygenase family)
MILKAKSSDTLTSEFYTRRPCQVLKNKHNLDWANRGDEMRAYLKAGVVPFKGEAEKGNISPYLFFGPTMSFVAGRGKNPKSGVWNDIREDEHWDVDYDAS